MKLSFRQFLSTNDSFFIRWTKEDKDREWGTSIRRQGLDFNYNTNKNSFKLEIIL